MPRVRGEEAWAAAVISRELGGVEVRIHDDGSQAGMHDLDILYSVDRSGAVEVTTATDPGSTELWRLINPPGFPWIEPGLRGGWFLTLSPTASARRLRAELPSLLADLEASGVAEFSGAGDWRARSDDRAERLRIVHGAQGGTSRPGSIYFTIELPLEQSGGAVPETGDPVAAWVSEWTKDPVRSDNLSKLGRSHCQERHLVVILRGFSGTPFGVAGLLMRDGAPLPEIDPELPAEVTHLWVWSGWNSGDVFRWTRQLGWTRASKLTDRSAVGQGREDG